MSRGKPAKILELLVICAVVMVLRALGVADPLAAIEGSIVDSRAVAITGATVRVSCGTTNLFARVDGSGHFQIGGLPAGTCTVTAAATGYASRSTSLTVKAGSTARVSIVLAAAPKAPPPPPPVAKPPMKEMEKRADRKSVAPSAQQPMDIEDDPDHNTEQYSRIDDNPFKRTSADPLSTFSADVDTASYSNMRRFLRQGQLPPKDAIRIEELINYFHYDYPAPQKADPFSITTEVGASPWNAKLQLLRIGLKAPVIEDAQVPARNLVFLLDVSGSMMPANKLPLLKQAMGLLVETLRPQDKISIVVYAGASGTALAPTSGDRKDAIRSALFALEAGGSTNGAAGIQLAYDLAEKTLIKGGINRVILCTDGDFNVGTTSEGDLTRLIEKERERGVFLTVLGFGMGNLKDSTMEKLADRGNGNYAYIDSIEEARKVLVKEAGATLVTVAKDVKLQVEFNPATVAGYRLIGYENRMLRHEDFNDDKKDAGDIGAGHSVTALYEIVPAGVEVPQSGKVDPLKYQTKPATTTGAVASGELLTVKVRYKAPDGKTSKLLSRVVKKSEDGSGSVDMRWATAMAGFGMMLRDSAFRGQLTWKQVETLARGAVGKDAEGYRAEALKLIELASKLPR
jgi:Ca-activated chloride channel homolog